MEEKNVFEEAVESTEVNVEDIKLSVDETEEEDESWEPIVSKESPNDKKDRVGVKKEMDGKTLTIKEVFFTKPKTKSFEGVPIEPKPCLTDTSKKFYPGKLGIRFEEEAVVEYYPNFHYFINEGKPMNKFAKINRSGKNAIAMLFKLAIKKMGKKADDVSDQDFYDFLIGKKVKIKTESDIYLNKRWFRNDIVAFVD